MDIDTLTCPITLDLFEDPITTPCGHSFSRLSLARQFENTGRRKCPVCNQMIENFDPITAAKNITLANLVDSYRSPSSVDSKQQKWSCSVLAVEGTDIAELKIALENSTIATRPTLFVMIVDISGSMWGDPMRQVREALKHTMAMIHGNPFVKPVLVTYNSTAHLIDISGSLDNVTATIEAQVRASGGNNEEAAFRMVGDILQQYSYNDDPDAQDDPNNVSNVTVAFLTDGQACRNRKELIDILSEVLDENWVEPWDGPLTIHTIGFSRSCDRDFLEDVRKVGSIEGIFRYAEPQDNDNTLCQKLESLFEAISSSSRIPVTIEYPEPILKSKDEYTDKLTIQFPIGRSKKGSYSQWIKQADQYQQLKLIPAIGNPETLAIKIRKPTARMAAKLCERWISQLIDDFATELIDLNATERDQVFELHAALLQQRIEAVTAGTTTPELLERLDFVADQLTEMQRGAAVHLGKLSDLRFASQFAMVATTTKAPQVAKIFQPQLPVEKPVIDNKARWQEKYIRYSHNNTGKDRNQLQQAITDRNTNRLTADIKAIIDQATLEDLLHVDKDGNNAIHLAAYCGQNFILEELLAKFTTVDITTKNPDGETPLTLAIKGHGFWKILKILLKKGAEIPDGRKEGLQQYAVDNGYEVTGKILGGIGDSAKEVNHSMSAEYVEFLYETATENNVDINPDSYLDVCLAKGMTKLVKTILVDHHPTPTIDQLLEWCIPPKPDHPKVDHYLDLAKIVLATNPELINATNSDGESPLFKACERGNLPHVQYFLKKGAVVDQPNCLGNSPLWVACAKRYPCIIDELLEWGADVNRENHKGNPPMYGLCQKQNTPIKIVKKLLAAGATVNAINKKTKDTLILICCRNNKAEILKLLLDYVDCEFAQYKAEIDGFDAVMAATEADNPECIQVLADWGLNVETPTDPDNQILPGATPLHLAAYYNCQAAASKLIQLGANVNAKTPESQTPLHIAVIQGNLPICKVLRSKDANPSIKDKWGNTPVAYSRSGSEIRKVLVAPVLEPLLKLACGSFDKDQERKACAVLEKNTRVSGFLTATAAIDPVGIDGSTPLMQAVMHSNFNIVQTLLKLGADPNKANYSGVNSFFWARWLRNPRVLKLVEQVPEQDRDNTLAQIERVKNADAPALFLIDKPAKTVAFNVSELNKRMGSFINVMYIEQNSDTNSRQLLLDGPRNNQQAFVDSIDPGTLWNCQIHTINAVASNSTTLDPYHHLLINMYTSIPNLAEKLNSAIAARNLEAVKHFGAGLYKGLESLAPFVGEVYLGANGVDRQFYQPGNEFYWPTFMSGSTTWKIAMEAVPDFDNSKKRGTMFIVKSKSGRFVGSYSYFASDAEVIFAVGSKFRVSRWYRGDKICLGQANIREYTFAINDCDELERMCSGDKSLIIELEEVSQDSTEK